MVHWFWASRNKFHEVSPGSVTSGNHKSIRGDHAWIGHVLGGLGEWEGPQHPAIGTRVAGDAVRIEDQDLRLSNERDRLRRTVARAGIASGPCWFAGISAVGSEGMAWAASVDDDQVVDHER